MKNIIFLGLLSLVTMNFLSADEYLSDTYLEEIASQSEIIDNTLPITKTVEEEEREKQTALNIEVIENLEELSEFVEANHTSKLTPLSDVNSSIEDKNSTLSPYLRALKKARDEGKIIMISIRAMHCKYCDKMETETLSDKSVQEALKNNFISIYYNQDLESLPLALQKGVTPNFVFVNTHEDILNQYPGMRTPTEFKEVLAQILSM